jgi:hypothetical protein
MLISEDLAFNCIDQFAIELIASLSLSSNIISLSITPLIKILARVILPVY